MARQEEEHQIPQGATPLEAFVHSTVRATYHLDRIPDFHGLDLLANKFTDAVSSGGLFMFETEEVYDQHIEAAGRNAFQPPYGVEIDTLSPNVRLMLYPRTIFQPTDQIRESAEEEGVEVRTTGPQAMLYVLDRYTGEAVNTINQAANFIFIANMVDALLTGQYPAERDTASPEFAQQVEQGMRKVREYTSRLIPEQRARLSTFGNRIAEMEESGLSELTAKYVKYQTEHMKSQGLRDEGYFSMESGEPGEQERDAVAKGQEYLHVTDRNLPVQPEGTEGVPSLPWREYGRNRWNRDYQLFGRYEALVDAGELLRVDFKLDSTHMPAKYGFFDTIEIARVDPEGEITNDHVILGQEVNHEQEEVLFSEAFFGSDPEGAFKQAQGIVFPVVIAGSFDFSRPEIREKLDLLINDKGTKREVSAVLADTMRLADNNIIPKLRERSPEIKQELQDAAIYIKRIAAREVRRGGKDLSLTELASELEEIVRSSEAFSWSGIAAKLNAEGKATHVIFHLLRKPDVTLPPETEIDIELLLGEIEANFFLTSSTKFDRFITNRPEYTSEGFREELVQRYEEAGDGWTMINEWPLDNSSSRT